MGSDGTGPARDCQAGIAATVLRKPALRAARSRGACRAEAKGLNQGQSVTYYLNVESELARWAWSSLERRKRRANKSAGGGIHFN